MQEERNSTFIKHKIGYCIRKTGISSGQIEGTVKKLGINGLNKSDEKNSVKQVKRKKILHSTTMYDDLNVFSDLLLNP